MMKRILVGIFLFCLTFQLIAEDQPTFKLSHSGTTEYRTTSEDGGECQLIFTLTGDRLDEALEAGNWTVDSARDDTGSTLTALDGFQANFFPLKKRPTASGIAADIKLGLTVPSRSASLIQTLSGSIGIQIYRRQVVIIENLEQNRNQLVENPLFQAHDFTVQIIDPQHAYPGYSSESERATLLSRAIALRIEGEIDKVDSFTLVDPDGNPIPTRSAGFGAGRSRIMALMSDTPLPTGVTAHLLIPIDPKEIRIPFSFTNIPLP